MRPQLGALQICLQRKTAQSLEVFCGISESSRFVDQDNNSFHIPTCMGVFIVQVRHQRCHTTVNIFMHCFRGKDSQNISKKTAILFIISYFLLIGL